jgi:hypothetical protein
MQPSNRLQPQKVGLAHKFEGERHIGRRNDLVVVERCKLVISLAVLQLSMRN